MQPFRTMSVKDSMKTNCLYCAQTDTKKDGYGYCKKYDCFTRSGMKQKLENLVSEAKEIWFMPDTYGQVGTVVSNSYSHRTRKANEIMNKAKNVFGFVPMEVAQAIPEKNRGQWDKNIRW